MQAAQDISFQALTKKLTKVVDIIKSPIRMSPTLPGSPEEADRMLYHQYGKDVHFAQAV